MTALLKPKLRAATAFRYVGGVAPTATDWFVIGERFDEENPNDAMATIVHLRPGDTQVLGNLPTRAVQLQASRSGLCVLGSDGVVRIKPRVAGAGRKASRDAAWVPCAEHVVAIGGSLRTGWWLNRNGGRWWVMRTQLDGVDAIKTAIDQELLANAPTAALGAFLAVDDGFAAAIDGGLWLGDARNTTRLTMTAPIVALAAVPADVPTVAMVDRAGRLGLVARNATQVADVQWLGQTDIAVNSLGVVGSTVLLGSLTRGLFSWQEGQAMPLRPSLRASHMSQAQGGVLITSDLFVAHYDGTDFMARDLSSTIRAAESAG